MWLLGSFLQSCRILQLYAEENAVDDTIYYLGEALRKGVIELEAFLKVHVYMHAC